MAIFVLHNMDSQGGEAARRFAGLPVTLYRVRFIGPNIDPQDFAGVQQLSPDFRQRNTVFWLGHGDENALHRGHPVTDSKPPRRIDTTDLVNLLAMLSADRIYFMTCMAMRWVDRNRDSFSAAFSFWGGVRIYAASTRISGAMMQPTARKIILDGEANPPGAFGQGLAFEVVDIT